MIPEKMAALALAYSKKFGVSFEKGVEVLLHAIDVTLDRNTKLWAELGGQWAQLYDETIVAQEMKRKQRREQQQRFRSNDRLKKIPIDKLITNKGKSGYLDVHANGTGWRARIKTETGWKYLTTRKTPEEAAFDRLQWCEKNSPQQLLSPFLKELYDNYMKANPNSSHEQALDFAQVTAQNTGVSTQYDED